jgi:hypothetical protein
MFLEFSVTLNCDNNTNIFINESIMCSYTFDSPHKLTLNIDIQEYSLTPDTNKSVFNLIQIIVDFLIIFILQTK